MVYIAGAAKTSVAKPDSAATQLAFNQTMNGVKTDAGTARPKSPPNGGKPPGGGNDAASQRPPLNSGQGVSAARRRQIDNWVDHDSDGDNHGFLDLEHTSAAQHVDEALTGHARQLGSLTSDEQRYLMDEVLDRWSDGKGDGPGGAADLEQSLKGSPQLSDMFADRLSREAVSLMQRPAGNGSYSDPHVQARAYALDAVEATSGDLDTTPSNDTRLRQMLNGLGPADAAALTRALGPTTGDFASAAAQDRVLAAVASGPETGVASAVTQTVFADSTPEQVHTMSGLRTNLAASLARGWYPDDPGRQTTERTRLAGILGTVQGDQLLFGSGTTGKIPLDAHVNALAIIRSDPSITAATLGRTSDPWTNPAILGPMAQANAQQYLHSRGDQPLRLQGTDLDNTIGYAMGFPPTVPHDATDAQAKAADGRFSYFAQGPGQKPVQAVVDQIHKLGGDSPRVTVLPIEYGSSDYGPVQLPLFRVETASGDKYVDNTGRSYASFQDWKDHNQLPPGTMFYPDQGTLSAGPDGTVKLAHSDTPSTPDTAWKQAKSVLNGAALVGGIIAGGALIIGTDGLATPVVAGIGVASGLWGAYTSGSELADRSGHGQSINPVTDSTARGLWLSLAADTAGMGAFASEAALVRIAGTEGKLGAAAAWTIGTAKAASNVTNAAAFANAGIGLASNWGAMTPAQRAESVLSLGFWGATLAVGAKQARSPGDLFNPAAMTRAISDAYQPPVTRSTDLPGNEVRIVTDPQTGRPAIVAGEHASAGDIQLHVNVARMMAQDQGLQGQIKAVLGSSDPRPGTLAYSVKYESIKLNQKIAALQSRLADPGLTAQQRSQVQGDIDTTRAYLDQEMESLAGIARAPQKAFIAAPSDGLARARELPGLVESLDGNFGGQGYYFRDRGPGLAPEIVRSGPDKPRLAAVNDNGTWRVQKVNTEELLPVYSPHISDGAASEMRLPEGLSPDQKAQLDHAVQVRQQQANLAHSDDPAVRKEAIYQESVQSNRIGTIGARAYVQSEFKGAQEIYDGTPSRPGDFDQVYRQNLPDGRVRFVVVEAKGGQSALGTKEVDGQVVTQGTAPYFESTAKSMSAMPGEAGKVGADLLQARESGKVRGEDGKLHDAEIVYLQVRTPIGTKGVGTVKAQQFNLDPGTGG